MIREGFAAGEARDKNEGTLLLDLLREVFGSGGFS
jgi:hypothetical protein